MRFTLVIANLKRGPESRTRTFLANAITKLEKLVGLWVAFAFPNELRTIEQCVSEGQIPDDAR